MKFNSSILSTLLAFLLFSCSGSDSGENPNPTPQVKVPKAATLVFPANNTECNEGSVISADLSGVLFQWNASENTDSYTLKVTNLDSNTTQEQSTTNTSLSIAIARGTPFSWTVVSKSTTATETAQAAPFRFFNAGAPVENHTPFPAEALNPGRGATLTGVSVVTLSWDSSDIDNDLASHSVTLLGSTEPLESVDFSDEATRTFGTTTTQSFSDINVESNTIYYWQVTSTDAQGNSALSEIFDFRIN